jgi:hypothetical protein
VLRNDLPPADPKIILPGNRVANRSRAAIGMDQAAVGVRLDRAVVVSDRDVRPLIDRRDIARVNKRPARIAVGKAPADRTVRVAGDYILALLVFFPLHSAKSPLCAAP